MKSTSSMNEKSYAHEVCCKMKAPNLATTKEPVEALPPPSDHCSTSASDSEELFPFSRQEMAASLGEGPMRFAPKQVEGPGSASFTASTSCSTEASEMHDSSSAAGSSSSRSARSSPSSREKQCCQYLKRQWEASNSEVPFSYEMYLRTIEKPGGPSPEYTPFGLCIEELEPQLLTETLFPVPGLRSSAGLEMFYMRPSRYFPKQTPTEVIIDNLSYVMQSMAENETACQSGIGFLANMKGWRYEHFSVRYCSEFMAMLQQKGPARVKLFLIVDPPSWFPSIWRIMKGMLSKEFRKKVFMIRETALHEFLEPGFEEYLPDDMPRGKTNTHQLVHDFIAYRKFVEDAIGIDI